MVEINQKRQNQLDFWYFSTIYNQFSINSTGFWTIQKNGIHFNQFGCDEWDWDDNFGSKMSIKWQLDHNLR